MVLNVDYEYYTNTFYGVSIPEALFNSMAFKAKALVNQFVSGKDTGEYEEELKAAMCAVAEVLCQEHVRDGKASENTDGYSVSFDTSKSVEDKAYSAARAFLIHTGLLYRGVN